jgi:hypothetical protein
MVAPLLAFPSLDVVAQYDSSNFLTCRDIAFSLARILARRNRRLLPVFFGDFHSACRQWNFCSYLCPDHQLRLGGSGSFSLG